MNQTTTNDTIRQFLQSGRHYFALPSLSVTIIDADRGMSNFNFPDNGRQSIYKVGSLTKLVTCLAVLKLYEDKLLNPDDAVSGYLDWFDQGNYNLTPKPATILDLLLHNSGLPRGGLLDHEPSEPELANMMQGCHHDGKNVKTYKYSNLGYIALGMVVEKVSGQAFASYVKRKVFDPLGMSNSGFGKPDNEHYLTTPHGLIHFAPGAKEFYNLKEMPLLLAPRASFDMFSTQADFLKLIRCILDEGMYNDRRLWNAQIIKLLFDKKIRVSGPLFATMAGLSIATVQSDIIFQYGEHWGHSSSVLFRPKQKFALFAMANRGSAGAEIAYMLQKINKYLMDNRPPEYLNYNYPAYYKLTGNYHTAYGDTVTITAEGSALFMAGNGEAPGLLVYKGQGYFLQTAGSLSKYIIKPSVEYGQVTGINIGPRFYYGPGKMPGHGTEKQYPDITGIYHNDKAGRVALFERNNLLVLAYSPAKEGVLKQISPTVYNQINGPFLNEEVIISPGQATMQLGQLTFKNTGIPY